MNINPYAKGAASGAYEQGVKTAADYAGVTSQLDAIAPLSGASDPTTSTVGAIGQRYLNTASGAEFTCTAAAGGVYTWTRRPMAGLISDAPIETITLTQDVGAVIPAQISQYDEIAIEYTGTASVATPILSVRKGSTSVLAALSLTSMTTTRYINIIITRIGADRLRVEMVAASNTTSVVTTSSIITPAGLSVGMQDIQISLSSTYTFMAGGEFKIWGRKWAV